MSRVIRGGSSHDFSGAVRSEGRSWDAPDYRYFDLGFRLVQDDLPSLLVLRGGSWINSPRRVSSVFRERDERTYCGYYSLGFRLLQDTK